MSSAKNHMKRSHKSEVVRRSAGMAQHKMTYMKPEQVKRREESPLGKLFAAMRAKSRHAAGRRRPRESKSDIES